MPAVPKLKVYRTPIGFHDAYVAAPSQKAALAAWGSDKDLFARGAAELVTDPALTAAPLAAPGTVVKKLRATADEQFAALPPDTPRAKPAARKDAPRKPAAKPVPRPDRDALDAANRAVEAAAARHRDEDRALAEEEAALARRRKALRAAHDAEARALDAARQAEAERFDTAMARWRDGAR